MDNTYNASSLTGSFGSNSTQSFPLLNQSYQTEINVNQSGFVVPNEFTVLQLPRGPLMKFQSILDIMRIQYVAAIVVVGLIGNSFSMVVLIKTKLSELSYVQYILAMLVTDIIFIVNILSLWLVDMGVDMYQLGAWCHLSTFLSHSSSFLSLWYVVCVAVDRLMFMLGMMRPGGTTLHAKMAVLALAMVAIAVFLNMSLTFGVVYIGPSPICTPLTRFYRALQALGRIDVFLNCVIPYVFLLIVFTLGCVAMCCRCCGNGLVCGDGIGLGMGCPEDIPLQGQVTGPITFIGYYLLLTAPAQAFRVYMAVLELQGVPAMMDLRMVLLQKTLQYVHYTRYALNIVPLWIFYIGFRRSAVNLLQELCCKLCCLCSRQCAAIPAGIGIEDTAGCDRNRHGWGETQRNDTRENLIREGEV